MIASNARSGPIPLRWAYGALRGIGPTLAEEARGRMGLSRCARGALVIASKARYGPIPLRLAYGALRGIGPALAEEALGRRGFRALREGFWCSLPRLAADRSRWRWVALSYSELGLQGAVMDGIIWTAGSGERR